MYGDCDDALVSVLEFGEVNARTRGTPFVRRLVGLDRPDVRGQRRIVSVYTRGTLQTTMTTGALGSRRSE